MPRKRPSAEQIVTKLRQIDVLVSQGKTAAAACKEAGTTEQSYYRWRNEYGGLAMNRPNGSRSLSERTAGSSVWSPICRWRSRS